MLRKSLPLLQFVLNLALKTRLIQPTASSFQRVALSQYPSVRDHEAWHAYWKAQGQPWRTEPEIDIRRQQELTLHRAIVPDIKQGIYPFKRMKLSRADIEWLLATHENGRGPVDWNDMSQRGREGLDLRGSNLQQTDLHRLPLAMTHGGLFGEEWIGAAKEQIHMAAIHLEECNLRWAHLEGSKLTFAHLEGADLRDAHLEGADFHSACFAQRNGDFSLTANLQKAFFDTETAFRYVVLCDENGRGIQLADVHWNEADLTTVDWMSMKMLGEEYTAKQKKDLDGTLRTQEVRLFLHQKAVRTYRQLTVALQSQGLNEEAVRFVYRAQVLQKTVFRLQMVQSGIRLRYRLQAVGAWFFSWFLFLLAGYGYRFWRSFLVYILVIIGFMMAYYLIGSSFKPHLSLVNALGLSMTSFHGRGFFPGVTQLNDPLTILTSLEAFVGLILEATFIATLTQRFFGK